MKKVRSNEKMRLLSFVIAICFVVSGFAIGAFFGKNASVNGIKLYERKDTKTKNLENELFFDDFVEKSNHNAKIGEPGFVGVFEEDINYNTRTLDAFGTKPYKIPGYDAFPDESGNFVSFSGGTRAAGDIMAWYNGMVDGADLIPGHEPWQYFLGEKVWNEETRALHDAFAVLRDDMQSYGGVTINNYFNGLDKYVTRMGRSLSYNTNFLQESGDLAGIISSSFIDALKSEKMLTVFMSGFLLGDDPTTIQNGVDYIGGDIYDGLYVMPADGYSIYTYYDENGNQIRQDIYLNVRDLFHSNHMVRLTSHTTLYGLYATQIVS
ncbi:MAG: hypothetical protein FWF56_03670 [Firmicutes bacterium]|nr:hypothetical protein [Bacillota bacterium]